MEGFADVFFFPDGTLTQFGGYTGMSHRLGSAMRLSDGQFGHVWWSNGQNKSWGRDLMNKLRRFEKSRRNAQSFDLDCNISCQGKNTKYILNLCTIYARGLQGMDGCL